MHPTSLRPKRFRHGIHRSICAALTAAALAALPLSGSAGAARTEEPPSLQELQQRRDQVRADRAERAAQVDALRATDAELASALAALNANVNIHQDRLEEAERAVIAARADQQAAEEAVRAKEAELDELQAQISSSAVQAYMRVGSTSPALLSLRSDDMNDAVNKRALLSVQANNEIGLTERFRSVQEDLAIQQDTATAARRRAEQNQADVTARITELQAASAEQQAFAAAVDERLNAALAEADALAALDTGLARDITERQTEIARAVEAQRRAEAARAAQRASQNRARVIRAAPTPEQRGPDTARPSRPSGPPPPITGSGSIVSVAGIRVHESIAANLANLLSAASAAGIQLSGGGYRDSAGQIATRRNNCGTSEYAIYQMPASSCSPPTARPGSSMHERGLAIDFTQGGRILNRSSPGFTWLKGNAARFGLYNLPSEPWHWSTNGN